MDLHTLNIVWRFNVTTYKVKVIFEAGYSRIVCIKYKKERWLPTIWLTEVKIYPGLLKDETIKDIEVNSLIRFVKDYLTKILQKDEVIVEFKMEV